MTMPSPRALRQATGFRSVHVRVNSATSSACKSRPGNDFTFAVAPKNCTIVLRSMGATGIDTALGQMPQHNKMVMPYRRDENGVAHWW
jgi:hypothetical protein